MAGITNYSLLTDKRRRANLPAPQDISLKNRLVGMLPPLERALLLDHSELIELKVHQKLNMVGEHTDHTYFPIDSFISVVLELEGVANMEVATVGNEGMFNMAGILGAPVSTFSALVQGAGRALKIHRKAFAMRRAEDARLRNMLFRYFYVATSQLAQRTVCMNHHTVEQRLARALLTSRDRTSSHELFLTHEALAFMTGARRESISHAASVLQKLGRISYNRGYIVLLDEPALELI
jgi:CRP-like cAMP-binding protein